MLTSFTCFALQYSAVDSNPLSIYVMHPFWNFVVKVRKPPVSTHHCFRALFLIASSAVLSLNIQGWLSISVSTVFTDLAGSKPHHIHRIHVPRVKFRHVGFLRFWLQRLRYVLFTAFKPVLFGDVWARLNDERAHTPAHTLFHPVDILEFTWTETTAIPHCRLLRGTERERCLLTLYVSQLQDMNMCLVGSGLLLAFSTSWPIRSVSLDPCRSCLLSFGTFFCIGMYSSLWLRGLGYALFWRNHKLWSDFMYLFYFFCIMLL